MIIMMVIIIVIIVTIIIITIQRINKFTITTQSIYLPVVFGYDPSIFLLERGRFSGL